MPYRALLNATKTAAVTTGAVVELSDFSFDADHLVVARRAVVSTITNNVMATWSGVDPTSTLGHMVTAVAANRPATTLYITGPSFINLKFIAVDNTATVTITLER